MEQFQQNVFRSGLSRNEEIGDVILALELILIEVSRSEINSTARS